MMRIAVGLVVAALAAAGGAQPKQEVRVMTSGALTVAHTTLAPLFERATGHRVVTLATSTGVGTDSIASRVRRGEPVDVLILPRAALDELIAERLVVEASRVDLARSSIGMAVRRGAPRPDISSVDALRATLLAARSVAYSASVSGVYLSTELFPRLGIAEQMKATGVRVERGRVGTVVARGEAEIGFQQLSELLEVPGVDVVGALPAEVQRVTVVSAGLVAGAANVDAARRYVEYFRSADGVRALRQSGVEPLTTP